MTITQLDIKYRIDPNANTCNRFCDIQLICLSIVSKDFTKTVRCVRLKGGFCECFRLDMIEKGDT
jgi:hypothetical protein